MFKIVFAKNLVLVEENLVLVEYRYEGEIIEDLFLLDVVIYILKQVIWKTRNYILYNYLMGVQAIDQNIFPLGIVKDQSVLLPEVKDGGRQKTLVFPNTEGENCLIYCLHSH